MKELISDSTTKGSATMSHLEKELELLSDEVLELMHLVKTQMEKGWKALKNHDLDLAEEIQVNERRVDALELTIDRDCENILALFNPVAIDLRFVLACIKINSDLERVGDHANSMAGYIQDFDRAIDGELFKKMQIDEMYETVIQMLNNVFNAFIKEDTELASKVFSMDKKLNKINAKAAEVTEELIKNDVEGIGNYLYLFSIVRKLERVGDLTKNTAEEIVFHIEAKVLKHKKSQSRAKKAAK